MTQSNQNNKHLFSRRDALKALAATSGATALSMLPNKWETPFVDIGALPALAQTSPAQYTFTNEIESIDISGPGIDSSMFQTAVVDGWIVIAQAGSTVGKVASPPYPHYPWILSNPWIHVKRKWDVLINPWEGTFAVFVEVKIKIKFKHLTGFLETDVPADETELWAMILSGANLAGMEYYVKKFKIKKNKIELKILLPLFVGTLGELVWPFYPFLISCQFPFPFFLASGGGSHIHPGYYLGPGIFGNNLKSSWFK